MIDPLEHRLDEWMENVGRFDTTDVRDLVQDMEIPARRQGRILRLPAVTRLGAVAAVLIAVVVGVGLGTGALGPGPIPPDPRSFAGDPRLERCGAFGLGQPSFAFELAHASDFQRVFPAALRTPELERPDPAFVVVLSAGRGQGIGGGAPAGGTPGPSDEGRSICVLLGSGPDAELNLYSDVDVTGFSPELARRFGPEPGVTNAPATSTPAPSTPSTTTPTPMPGEVGQVAVTEDQAVAIARGAAGDILSWLADDPVVTAEVRPYRDLRSLFEPMPAPDLPDDRDVWLIVLASSGSGQGATVFVDASDGMVLRAVSWIS